MELGHRLKLFRVAANIKQKDLAQHLDVSANYVYMVEKGQREPSLDYLKRFAKLVKVPLAALFLEPAKDPKTRKLTDRIMSLMAEYANVTGVNV